MADDGRLFDLDAIPEVPLFREPRRAKAARGATLDARFKNEYPADWHRCTACGGTGHDYAAEQRFAEAEGVHPAQMLDHKIPCPNCLGMGSLKARARFEAGHRCERCLHPYVPKGDAKILGVDSATFRWSRCDYLCAHRDPIRVQPLTSTEWHELPVDDILAEPGGTAGDIVSNIEAPLFVEAEWRILTVHHLDGDKANCRWWNLAALCQRCHLEIQAKVVLERVYPHEHTPWFKPHAAGWYAYAYLGEDLTRDETLARLDSLLDLERAA